ncbi:MULTISPECIES: 50S ribosomal protein L4 [Parvimonas]|jgi:50S ribosomal protein L4|uniref:Large ribosomal subunit protein uL4 n=1 Tax=Parvimonas micra TaxID=33033 RepID=A0A0B4S0G8_9FIRM|nr:MULTISPECIES: 50S ribosomal protein L4 [Parvimonas]AIZ36357.1 50S ribosomal protein L4 [Parvimonas micra]MBF1275648.1 50S ribosomal protein L4 [Parvimonas micra]MBF1306544.1 50S ribosomal protein L4 [Parvimonas micra]MCZ7407741.1 50S ribosomal protein L4 [Parvimonas micra]MCZ7408381.1 50S ribosomal protein L4 [Parvimonas micra]
MPKVNVYNQLGEVVGDIELNEAIFGIEVNEHVVYEVVKNHLANRRQGTQSAKTRAEVRGGGRKPWRQKGTGRARQGSIRAPQWKGGGVVFAPKPRSYRYSVPKKVRRLAMKSVLSSKVLEGELRILDALTIDAFSTKKAKEILKNLSLETKTMIVLPEGNDMIIKSFANLPKVETVVVDYMNVYDLMRFDNLVIVKDALSKIEEVYA